MEFGKAYESEAMKQGTTTVLLASLIACAIPGAAYSECIMRTTSLTRVVGKVDDVADIRPLLSPSFNNERRCAISARVLYRGSWHTVYSDYTGPVSVGDRDLCSNAVELGVRQFLASKEAKLLHSDQQMVCSDEPEIKVRPVQKGELVRISEVAPHPEKPDPFAVKGVECRWFIEPAGSGATYYRWQGVVCRTGRRDSGEWTVVDKF